MNIETKILNKSLANLIKKKKKKLTKIIHPWPSGIHSKFTKESFQVQHTQINKYIYN